MSPALEMTAINFYVVTFALLAWELNSKTTMFPLLSNDIKTNNILKDLYLNPYEKYKGDLSTLLNNKLPSQIKKGLQSNLSEAMPQIAKKSVIELSKKGSRLFRSGEYVEAERVYREALTLDESDAIIQAKRGKDFYTADKLRTELRQQGVAPAVVRPATSPARAPRAPAPAPLAPTPAPRNTKPRSPSRPWTRTSAPSSP